MCFKCIFLLLIFTTKPQNAPSVPTDFYGSSEIRFLNNKDSILDAFTRFQDDVLISGDVTSIESLLATSDRTGKLQGRSQDFLWGGGGRGAAPFEILGQFSKFPQNALKWGK